MRTATWYVWVESDATTTMTPTMQKNMYTTAHHTKLAYADLTSDTMDEMNAISQASYKRKRVSGPTLQAPMIFDRLTIAMEIVASANGSPIM